MFKPKSFHLQWHLTERCFLSCTHCYQNPKMIKDEIGYVGLETILTKFINQIQIWQLPKESVRISLTGGEPLVKLDFFRLLEKLYENRQFFNYGILTNGILLTEEKVKKLKNLHVKYVQISLEGLESVNDSIRGIGTFKKITSAMKLLRKEGISASFSMTVSKKNIQDVPQVIKLGKELDVTIGINRLVPTGRGKGMEDLLLSPTETEELYSRVLNLKNSYWNKISFGCVDGILVQFSRYTPNACSAGYASFTVMPNGDVYPCRRLGIYSGNLLKENFSDVYYQSKSLQELRNLNNINKKCQACRYFSDCHGGAKCVNYAYYGDQFESDPQCWKLFNQLPQKKMKKNIRTNSIHEKLDSKWIAITS